MAKIEALDFKRRRAVPTKYKTLLVLFCILGVLIHSYWNKKRIETLVVDQETIMFEEINNQSVIINFRIKNITEIEKSEKVKIEIVDQDKNLITSTIKFLKFKSGDNIFNEQVRFNRRYPDINERDLRVLITIQPRKL